MATPNLDFQNFYSSTLSSTITAADTTIYLNSLPTPSEGYLVIDPDNSATKEIIYYTSKGANFVTVPTSGGRGVGGTTAVAHSSGATVNMNNVAEMWTAIKDGSANTGMHQWFDESLADYVQAGATISQATGLIASISSGVVYINGRRLTLNAVSKTLTASKDTYVDIVALSGSNTATVSYTELNSGVTGSTPVSNGIHAGMVRSNASLLATIYQIGQDSLGNPMKNRGSVAPINLPAGSCVQQVSTLYTTHATGTTLIPFDTSIPQITEGDEYMTQTITPKSATNILNIDVTLYMSSSIVSQNLIGALFQDSTANALAAGSVTQSVNTAFGCIRITHTMTAGTVSPTTFRVRGGGSGAGTTTFNGSNNTNTFGAISKSSIVIREYTA